MTVKKISKKPEIEMLAPGKLKPHPRNSRRHPPEQIKKIAAYKAA